MNYPKFKKKYGGMNILWDVQLGTLALKALLGCFKTVHH